MRALIIGASSEKSIGYHIGEHWKRHGHRVAYMSRSGALGYACDVSVVNKLERIFKRVRPQIIVLAVGIALQRSAIDSFDDWQAQRQDIWARGVGSLATMIATQRRQSATHLIALGGRERFDDPKLGAYAVSNGALWGMVQHANAHARFDAWYVDMPFVIGSANAETLRAAGLHTGPEIAKAIHVEDVVHTVDEILAGQHKPGRIILGNSS